MAQLRKDHLYFVLFLTAACCLGASALAQVPNDVSLRAAGSGSAIVVTLDLDIGGELPADWVGWVVDRETVGACEEPTLRIGGPTPFPAGAQSYVLTDHLVVAGRTYFYRVYALDAHGVRQYLPGYTLFPPAYYQFDYASPSDGGLVAEGTVVGSGPNIRIETCPDGCWAYIAFVNAAPPALAALAGTQATVRVFGRIDAEFEGSYIAEVSAWSVVPGCSPVADEGMGWGALKALYR